MTLSPGQIVAGRYRIERFIAKGGFGAVYEAEQLETELRVALKVLWPQVLESAEAVEQFKLEARVAGRIASEHIVRVFDAGLDEATHMPFLVMELLVGQDLAHLLSAEGPRSGPETAGYFRQIASALDRAHGYVNREGARQPIVHRDLKPENLFLARRETGEPVIKILDFGIAKVLGQTTSVSQSVKGTPLYMSFEQLAGERITPQADIWALGLIAFQLLTGRSYWKAASSEEASVTQLFAEILTAPVEAASARAEALGAEVRLSSAFDAWFARCLAREPAQRFASAGECARELARVFGVPESTAASATAGERAPLGLATTLAAENATPLVAPNAAARPRRRRSLALGAGLALGVTAVALFGMLAPGPAKPAPDANVTPPSQPPRPEPRIAPVTDVAPPPTPVAPRLHVQMPGRVVEGQPLEIRVSCDREVRVVVLYLEETGSGARLLPSTEVPVPVAAPGRELSLPPLRPQLRRRGVAARERLIVYGLADAETFDRVARLPVGDDVAHAVAELDALLAAIAPERWARSEAAYVIEPR